MSKTFALAPDPEVQAAMRGNRGTEQDTFTLVSHISEIAFAAQLALNQSREALMLQSLNAQMLKEHLGLKKYDALQERAIQALNPPTEESKEIERLRAENEALREKLAAQERPEEDTDDDDTDSDDDPTVGF